MRQVAEHGKQREVKTMINEHWVKTGYIDNGVVLSHDGTFTVPYSEFKHCFPNPYDGIYTDSNGLKYGYIIDMADCSDVIRIVNFD